MKRNWIFLSNTFEVQTRNSHITTLSLNEDTYAKLTAAGMTDPVIQAIVVAYQPIYEAYHDMFALKQSVIGVYKGHTLQFENVLKELTNHVRVWESKVRVEFIEDSPDERKIFPGKRTPFLKGPFEKRISTVKSLSNTLAGYPVLSATKTLVDTYYNRLEGSRLAQQQKEGDSDSLSSLLESQRIITCKELYSILGQLMSHYKDNPIRVADFFDLTLLRANTKKVPTTVFSGQITDFNTGLPIASAVVRLPKIGGESTTDANGNFKMTLETGTHTVEVAAVGYLFYRQTEVELIVKENKIINVALKQ